jgi:hypothetical protein
MDPDYEQDLTAYGWRYQELSGPIWKNQYLCMEDTLDR